MLDWMLADSYRKLKDETQHRTRGLAIDAYIWTCLRRHGKEPEEEERWLQKSFVLEYFITLKLFC